MTVAVCTSSLLCGRQSAGLLGHLGVEEGVFSDIGRGESSEFLLRASGELNEEWICFFISASGPKLLS